MTEYLEKELQKKIQLIINGKITIKDEEYRIILEKLWEEFKLSVKQDIKMLKSRDKVIDELNSW